MNNIADDITAAYAEGYEQGKLDSAYDPMTAAKVAAEMMEKECKAFRNGCEQGKRDAVVHGAWVYEGYDGRFLHSWHCSGCGHVIRGSANLTKSYPFCNRCGARMDAQEGA